MSAIVQGSAGLRAPEPEGRLIDIVGAIRTIRRRSRLVIAVAVTLFCLILIGSIFIRPTFTSTAEVALDSGKQDITKIDAVQSDTQPAATGAVETEVEIIKSAQVAAKVIKQMRLESDPEFNAALRPRTFIGDLISAIRKLIAGPGVKGGLVAGVDPGVLGVVQKDLLAQRQGLTYAITISFTSWSSSKSAAIANNFAQAYIDTQREMRARVTQQANGWIEGRLNDLVGQVHAADQQLAQYKDANNLLNGTGNSTLAEQEITNLDQQLATFRAQQAEAEARLATARSQLARGSLGDDVGEALNSEVIRNLRSQRATVSAKLADYSSRYGPAHPEVLKAQAQILDIDSQIKQEIQRIISNLQAQVQAARERTASIAGSVGSARGSLASNNRASVQLDELQRRSTSVRSLYEALLNRSQETQAQANLPVLNAMIVSQAVGPAHPTFPNRLLVLAAAIVLGLGSGLALALFLELFDNRLTTSAELERRLGVPVTGSIPLLSSLLRAGERRAYRPTDYVVSKPLSSFSEAFRNLGVALLTTHRGEGAHVIEITSAAPAEGKTTTSICLARLLALSGRKVILVECDLRRRSFSRIFGKDPTIGLVEVVRGTADLQKVIYRDDPSGATVLPVGSVAKPSEDPFSAEGMRTLMTRLRADFDVVIMDAPPTLAVADARVLAQHVDEVLVIGRWRRTTYALLESCLKALAGVDAPNVRVALSQVDAKKLRFYDYGEAAVISKSYSPYYVN